MGSVFAINDVNVVVKALPIKELDKAVWSLPIRNRQKPMPRVLEKIGSVWGSVSIYEAFLHKATVTIVTNTR